MTPSAPSAVRPPRNAEVELKLLASAGVLEKLRESPFIARYARNAGVTRKLEAIYYDTSDGVLMHNGISLRVRRNGRQFVQTLKRAPVNGQPFVRAEWENAVSSTVPDLASLPIAEIGAPLDTLAADALNPVFVTKVRRRIQRLELPGGVVEVAFDEGSIEAGERSQPLSEVELELKAGDASVMFDLGLQLLEIAPLRVGTLSKSDRGYDLAFTTAKATKATPPGLHTGHTIDDVVSLLLGSCQHHLMANESVAERGRDPEGVHQMRVALRRLLTACALLCREVGSPTLEMFAAEAKWLAQVLGAARNWDVLLTDTFAAPMQAGSSALDFDGLRHAAEPHRLAAYDALRDALAGARYNRFQLALSRLIGCRGWRNDLADRPLSALLQPASSLAGRALSRLHRKAMKQGAHFRRLSPEGRHDLRIALKKLRYATEFFDGLFDDDTAMKNYLRCLAKLQAALGHANDATIAQPFLATLGADPLTPAMQRTIGAVIGWQARDRIEIEQTLRKHWRRFKATPQFWPDPA